MKKLSCLMLNLTTLYDLDILCPPHQQKASLWQELNYCRTDGGAQQLKKILLLEGHTLDNTIKRQQVVGYLCSKAKQLHFPIQETELFYLHHYLTSNYSIDETNTKIMLAVKSYTRLFTSKGDYLYILSAVKQALLIINQVRSVYEQLYSLTAPTLLKEIFVNIEQCLSKLQYEHTNTILNGEPNPMMLYTIDRQIRLYENKTVKQLLNNYYQLEAMCSLAKAHCDMQLNFPEFGNKLSITELYHPLVKNCVGNHVALNGEYTLLITGPNMAGKSTYLKSLGVCFVLAYIGIGVPAAHAQIPFFNKIITSINMEDDIGNGYSYFYNEVRKVKDIALSLKEDSSALIIADELFKGTNVKDANDCTETVINGFLQYPKGLFVVATHLTETVQHFSTNSYCRLLCFDGKAGQNNIVFNYQLKEGVSTTRLGKYIMEQESIPELFGL